MPKSPIFGPRRKHGPGNRKRLWLLRIAGVVGAVGIAVWTFSSLTPTLRFGDSYLKILIAAAVAAAILAGVFGILTHGDLKQRSDFTVALATAFVLLGLAEVGHQLYGQDWIWSKTCADPTAAVIYSECARTQDLFRYNHNAATLDQIYGVLAVGQIVPLLSIFKDAVYSWLRPTPWHEVSKDAPNARTIRKSNNRRTIVKGSNAPAMRTLQANLVGARRKITSQRLTSALSGVRSIRARYTK